MVSGKYRRAVFIVVYRRTRNIIGINKIKYLLLKREKHWKGWEFPKGGIEKGEKYLETAIRETKEECGQEGLDFKRYDFSGKYKYKNILKDRPGFIGQSFILFSTEVKNKKIEFDKNEHSSYKWLSIKKAISLVRFENQKKALKIVNGVLLR
jgi:8-oxo-dGTP pyrophosphatase MutT (NUDIX family)